MVDSALSERAQEPKQLVIGLESFCFLTCGRHFLSNAKDQDAELDKLVVEMNNAPTDKKLDAVAAGVAKLVEQRKALHEQMGKMMSANDKEGMGMCRMMMGCGQDGEHAHHH